MSIELVLYIIDILKNISTISGLLMVTSGLILLSILIILMLVIENDEESEKKLKKISRKMFVIFIISTPICIFIPSEKTLYMMVGSKYLKESGIPKKVHELINQKLDKLLEKDKET